MTAFILLLTLMAAPSEPTSVDTIPDCCADKLSWTDLTGRERKLDAYRGQFVVLNFWATWCLPCLEELPELVEIQNRYGIYGVQVVGAAADSVDHRDAVIDLAQELSLNFPVLLGATSTQMELLGLGEAIPATVIVDPDGKIVKRFSGVIELEQLVTILDDLLDRDEPIRRAALDRGHDHEHDHHDQGGGASLVPS